MWEPQVFAQSYYLRLLLYTKFKKSISPLGYIKLKVRLKIRPPKKGRCPSFFFCAPLKIKRALLLHLFLPFFFFREPFFIFSFWRAIKIKKVLIFFRSCLFFLRLFFAFFFLSWRPLFFWRAFYFALRPSFFFCFESALYFWRALLEASFFRLSFFFALDFILANPLTNFDFHGCKSPTGSECYFHNKIVVHGFLM